MSNKGRAPNNRGISLVVTVAACWAGLSHFAWFEQGSTSSDRGAKAAWFESRSYAQVLKRFVDDSGRVDYRGLMQSRRGLDEFVESLGKLQRRVYEQVGEKQQIALWLNAYNALTLKAVIDHYPIRAGFLKSLLYPTNSIRQIPGVWDSIRFRVLERDVTLDEIEHEIVRKHFDEPRIHLALVCASIGCPPLRREPYRGSGLGTQLDDQARKFLTNPEKFRISRNAGQVRLSAIFDWFKADFASRYQPESGFTHQPAEDRAVLNFISGYVGPSDAEYLRNGKYEIEYFEYDWSLNEQ